jgi:hypothetical protein
MLRPAFVEKRSDRVAGIWEINEHWIHVDPTTYGWQPATNAVRVDHAGPFQAGLELTRPYVRLERFITLLAGEDRGSPALPLALGNAWRYRLAQLTAKGNVYLGTQADTKSSGTIDASVVGETQDNGLHRWNVRVVQTDASGASQRDGPRVRLRRGDPRETRDDGGKE